MTKGPNNGTAVRQVGRRPLGGESDVPRRGQAGRAAPPRVDRWKLSNAIDDRLDWMPHPEYRVLRVLFRHADATGKAWPGQTGIGRSCGIERSHVSRCLGRLVRWGVIEVVRRGHKGSRKAGVYRIRSPSQWPTARPPD